MVYSESCIICKFKTFLDIDTETVVCSADICPHSDYLKCPFCRKGTVIQKDQYGNEIERYMCDDCLGAGFIEKSKFTCHKCKEESSCTFAYDMYNTNGDCLASK